MVTVALLPLPLMVATELGTLPSKLHVTVPLPFLLDKETDLLILDPLHGAVAPPPTDNVPKGEVQSFTKIQQFPTVPVFDFV